MHRKLEFTQIVYVNRKISKLIVNFQLELINSKRKPEVRDWKRKPLFKFFLLITEYLINNQN